MKVRQKSKKEGGSTNLTLTLVELDRLTHKEYSWPIELASETEFEAAAAVVLTKVHRFLMVTDSTSVWDI
jgi:hypothetical protein